MELYINDKAKTCENNGILKEHFAGFLKTAEEENVVIIVRPVNPITKVLLPQKYPTKHFSIKNKSSDWGIQCGFVVSLTELTFLSKTGLKNNETQSDIIINICNKFSIKLDINNKEKNKINPNSLLLNENEMMLRITMEHFNYLLKMQEKFGIIEYELFLENNFFVKCFQLKNNVKNEIIIFLEKESNDTFAVYYTFALDNENNVKDLSNKALKEIIETEEKNLIYFPIIVFCKVIVGEKKPFIPDYDLFAVCWIIDEAIKHHQPPVPTNSFASMKRNGWVISNGERDFSKIFKIPYFRTKSLNNEEELKIGNTLKNKVFLDKLNKNLGYEKGLDDDLCPIHHDFELININCRDFNENFYTVFLPNPELVTDFDFPEEMRVKSKKNIFYFAIDNSLGYEKGAWKRFLEPFLLHIQNKGYYVPNNCFVEESNLLGFANSSNYWVDKIRNERRMKKQLTETDSGYKSSYSVENINNINIEGQVLTNHLVEFNRKNNIKKQFIIRI